ncbi:MAG: serine/threonine protein kinase [Proteobacteria bacterium]|nr:serine/threonine protein kinase [Pseudomonadota bacterium]
MRRGRARESENDLDGALLAYLGGSHWNEAARILSHQSNFEAAGHAMLLYLPPTPTKITALDREQRHAVMNAALCFARSGARKEAVGLLINLGEYRKAANLLNSAGMRREAVAAMRGERVDENPWPAGVLFRLRQPADLAPPPPAPVSSGEIPAVQRDQESEDLVFPPMPEPVRPPPVARVLPYVELDDDDLTPIDTIPPDDRAAAVSRYLREAWDAEAFPRRLAEELEKFIARGRQPGAPLEDQVAFYAAGRLFERAGRPKQASRAYRIVPAILDASFRLSQTDQGKVETSDGQWLPPHIFGRGLRVGPAALPGLDGILLGARRQRDGPEDLRLTTDNPITPLPPPKPAFQYVTQDEPVQQFEGIGTGSLIDGRYTVEEEIGAGGMARMFRAIDTELGEEVALKLFLQLAREGSGLDRFRREMKLSRKLLHPNIVRVLEFGVWTGARYLTMELLKGADLEGFMASKPDKRVPLGEGLQLMMQACDGLAAAHAVGVIHRDIKPGNLFVIDEGSRLKVMDFGIAKVIGSSSLSITGVRVGTPRYMSPEQIGGGGATVGPPADLYALGGVMYEMFAGSPPFLDTELMPLLLNQMAEMPDPPRKRNPDIPPSVDEVIMKLLAKDPADRFRDARELRGELLRLWVETQRTQAP